jgi:hypothetical protein
VGTLRHVVETTRDLEKSLMELAMKAAVDRLSRFIKMSPSIALEREHLVRMTPPARQVAPLEVVPAQAGRRRSIVQELATDARG